MLEIITGGMFSGKSTELIRRIKRALIAQKNVVLFKPKIDFRYDEKKIVSHNKEMLEAIPIDNISDMKKFITDKTQVVGIDEVQFFDDKVVDLVEELVNSGINVIIAGLDQDYLGVPFKNTSILMSLADSVLKIRAICIDCGNDASKTYRIEGSKNRIEVGVDNYVALCRKCYNNRENAKKRMKNDR